MSKEEADTVLDTKTPVHWLEKKKFGTLELYLNNLYKRVKAHPDEEYKLILTFRVLARNYKKTNTHVQEWIESAPKSAQALLVRAAQREKENADKHRKEKTFGDIFHDLTTVFQKMPDHPVGHLLYTKARCHQIGGNCFEELISLQNKSAPHAYYARRELATFMNPEWGADRWVLKKYLDAIKPAARKNTHWRPLLGFKNYFSCLKLIEEKKEREALLSCEKALSFGPDEIYIRKTISLYMDLGDFPKARKAIESLRTAFPSDYWDDTIQEYVDTFTQHAKIFDGKGKTSVAIQAYSEILHLFPDHTNAFLARGSAYRVLGQWDLAEKDFLSVIARDPDNFSAYAGLDYTLAYQKRFQEIVPFWKAYLSRNPQNPKAHYELGGTYFHLGDYKNAYQSAQKACDLGYHDACQQAKRLKSR